MFHGRVGKSIVSPIDFRVNGKDFLDKENP